MSRLPVPALVAAGLLALAGCHPNAPAPDAPPEASVALDRVVTLGGPVTETVYALGLGDRVVGVDRSSLYPEAVHALPRLDYFRQTSAEGVLSLAPTVVLALEGTGPPAVLDQIRAAGVPVLTLPEVTGLAGAADRVRHLGDVIGRPGAADSLASRMRAEVGAVTTPASAPRALFVYARGAGTLLVSGTGNAADAVLRLAGAENAVAGVEGFQPLTAEAVVGAAPDVIVVPERGLESLGGLDGLLALPGMMQTPAGQARRVVAVDDALLLGFGPRVGEGVRDLARKLAASVPS